MPGTFNKRRDSGLGECNSDGRWSLREVFLVTEIDPATFFQQAIPIIIGFGPLVYGSSHPDYGPGSAHELRLRSWQGRWPPEGSAILSTWELELVYEEFPNPNISRWDASSTLATEQTEFDANLQPILINGQRVAVSRTVTKITFTATGTFEFDGRAEFVARMAQIGTVMNKINDSAWLGFASHVLKLVEVDPVQFSDSRWDYEYQFEYDADGHVLKLVEPDPQGGAGTIISVQLHETADFTLLGLT